MHLSSKHLNLACGTQRGFYRGIEGEVTECMCTSQPAPVAHLLADMQGLLKKGSYVAKDFQLLNYLEQ